MNLISNNIFRPICFYFLSVNTIAGTPCLPLVGDCQCNWKRAKVKCPSLEMPLGEVLLNFIPNNVKHLILKRSWADSPSSLSQECFMKMQDIQTLDLSFNFIEVIRPNTFHNMAHIASVNLSRNRIRFLEHNAFSGNLPRLKTIDLSNNRILILLDLTFASANSLLYLDLRNNTLHHVANDAFVGLDGLKSLKFSQSKFNHFPNRALKILKKLFSFELTDAVNMQHISASAFRQHPKLKSLRLEKIRKLSSETLHKDAFTNLFQLQNLAIVFCNLTKIPILKKLKNLMRLDLSQNPLNRIEREDFIGLCQLKELILRQTSLVHIETESFSSLSSLQSIDLSNNRLTTLSREVFPSNISEITKVKLEENWWRCDCVLSWIITELDFQTSVSEVTCTFPETQQGQNFEILKNLSENCSRPVIRNRSKTYVEVCSGENNTITTCSAEGNPTPSVSWAKIENDMTLKRLLPSEVLVITNASLSDEGWYRCEADNGIGTDFVEIYVEVKMRQWKSNLLHNGLLLFGCTIFVMFLLFLTVGCVVYHKFSQCLMHAS